MVLRNRITKTPLRASECGRHLQRLRGQPWVLAGFGASVECPRLCPHLVGIVFAAHALKNCPVIRQLRCASPGVVGLVASLTIDHFAIDCGGFAQSVGAKQSGRQPGHRIGARWRIIRRMRQRPRQRPIVFGERIFKAAERIERGRMRVDHRSGEAIIGKRALDAQPLGFGIVRFGIDVVAVGKIDVAKRAVGERGLAAFAAEALPGQRERLTGMAARINDGARCGFHRREHGQRFMVEVRLGQACLARDRLALARGRQHLIGLRGVADGPGIPGPCARQNFVARVRICTGICACGIEERLPARRHRHCVLVLVHGVERVETIAQRVDGRGRDGPGQRIASCLRNRGHERQAARTSQQAEQTSRSCQHSEPLLAPPTIETSPGTSAALSEGCCP